MGYISREQRITFIFCLIYPYIIILATLTDNERILRIWF